MTILVVTKQGQITLSRNMLDHLGIEPGGRLSIELLPNGRIELTAERSKGSWDRLRGVLGDKTDGTRLTIEEISDSIGDIATARRPGFLAE